MGRLDVRGGASDQLRETADFLSRCGYSATGPLYYLLGSTFSAGLLRFQLRSGNQAPHIRPQVIYWPRGRRSAAHRRTHARTAIFTRTVHCATKPLTIDSGFASKVESRQTPRGLSRAVKRTSSQHRESTRSTREQAAQARCLQSC